MKTSVHMSLSIRSQLAAMLCAAALCAAALVGLPAESAWADQVVLTPASDNAINEDPSGAFSAGAAT